MKKLFLGMLLVGFMGCLMLSTGCAGTDASQKTMQSEGAMQKEGDTMIKADAPMKKEGDTMMKKEAPMKKEGETMMKEEKSMKNQ